jgi:hypothetical protein
MVLELSPRSDLKPPIFSRMGSSACFEWIDRPPWIWGDASSLTVKSWSYGTQEPDCE